MSLQSGRSRQRSAPHGLQLGPVPAQHVDPRISELLWHRGEEQSAVRGRRLGQRQ